MTKEKVSDLAAAAMAYDIELRRFQELSEAARRTKLNSDRSITRAAEALQKAGESQQRLLEHVQKIVAAMNGGRGEQEQQAAALVELGQRINARRTRYGEILQKMSDLGNEAKEIHGMLTGSPGKDQFEAIRDRMEAAAQRAEAIASESRTEDLEDLERQADSLRQQLLSAKNKLSLLGKKLT